MTTAVRTEFERDRTIRLIREALKQRSGGVIVTGSNGYINITFSEYPGRPMVTALKAASFYWMRSCWGGHADKLDAECPAGVDPDVWGSIHEQATALWWKDNR